MRHLIYSAEFWVAMLCAILIKTQVSEKQSRVKSVISMVSAVLASLIFTGPVVAHFGLDPDTYTAAIAALIALTGEHIARQFLGTTIADIAAYWRGKK